MQKEKEPFQQQSIEESKEWQCNSLTKYGHILRPYGLNDFQINYRGTFLAVKSQLKFKTIAALVPPKPNEFEMAKPKWASFAV